MDLLLEAEVEAGAGGAETGDEREGGKWVFSKNFMKTFIYLLLFFFCISEILAILWIYLIENKRKTMPITQR